MQENLGKVMTIAAWVLMLILLAVFFDHLIRIKERSTPPILTTVNGTKKTIIERNFHNQYITQGALDGKPVLFLLDTGATHIVIPDNIANELKLSKGRQMIAHTAGGDVVVYETQIKELIVGNIVLKNMTATISPSFRGKEILLGMSALKRISFSQEGNRLILSQGAN